MANIGTVGGGELIGKENKDTFWVDVNVLHQHRGVSYMNVLIYQNCTVTIGPFQCM